MVNGNARYCVSCGQEMVQWHSAFLCLLCDNPEVGEGTWFEAWVEDG